MITKEEMALIQEELKLKLKVKKIHFLLDIEERKEYKDVDLIIYSEDYKEALSEIGISVPHRHMPTGNFIFPYHFKKEKWIDLDFIFCDSEKTFEYMKAIKGQRNISTYLGIWLSELNFKLSEKGILFKYHDTYYKVNLTVFELLKRLGLKNSEEILNKGFKNYEHFFHYLSQSSFFYKFTYLDDLIARAKQHQPKKLGYWKCVGIVTDLPIGIRMPKSGFKILPIFDKIKLLLFKRKKNKKMNHKKWDMEWLEKTYPNLKDEKAKHRVFKEVISPFNKRKLFKILIPAVEAFIKMNIEMKLTIWGVKF